MKKDNRVYYLRIYSIFSEESMPILWRYLLKSYLKVLLLCVFGFISVLIVMRAQEVARLIALNSNAKFVLLFTLCQIPYVLPIAIPISSLISSMILLKRLSHTHELNAFRALGLSLKQIRTPLIAAALLLSLINFIIVSEITPFCRLYSLEIVHKASSINPLFLMQKSKLLNLQGSYVDMNMTKLGKEAKDTVFIVKNESRNRLSLMSAKKILVKEGAMHGENIAFISHIETHNQAEFDHLILENLGSMSTPSILLTELMQKPKLSIGFEHKPLKTILQSAFFDQRANKKSQKQAFFELNRRIYFLLTPFVFTLMGISFGTRIGRKKSTKGFYILITLVALLLLSSITAKSCELFPIKAALLYFSPIPLAIFISFWFQKRINQGVEV